MIRAILLTAVLSALLTLVAARIAPAAPPSGTDPDSATAQWYRSLQTPEGSSCCSDSDCRAYPDDKVRVRDGAYEVFIAEEWRRVPADKILKGRPNPTGNAVACWLPSSGVLCCPI